MSAVSGVKTAEKIGSLVHSFVLKRMEAAEESKRGYHNMGCVQEEACCQGNSEA